MATVAEALTSIEAEARERTARREHADKFKKFYNSRAWRSARYRFLKTQPRPLRCAACRSATGAICVDHIEPIKKNWDRRLDASNFQLLCTDCNLAKASTDQTDWRADKIEAAS